MVTLSQTVGPTGSRLPSSVHKLTSSTPCYRCGRRGHVQQECKFKNATCHHCGKTGHIKPVCHSLQSYHSSNSSRHELSRNRLSYCHRPFSDLSRSTDSSRSTNTFVHRNPSKNQTSDIKQMTEDLFTVPANSRSPPLLVTVMVDDHPLQMEVDTGTSFTIISRATYILRFINSSRVTFN